MVQILDRDVYKIVHIYVEQKNKYYKTDKIYWHNLLIFIDFEKHKKTSRKQEKTRTREIIGVDTNTKPFLLCCYYPMIHNL